MSDGLGLYTPVLIGGDAPKYHQDRDSMKTNKLSTQVRDKAVKDRLTMVGLKMISNPEHLRSLIN